MSMRPIISEVETIGKRLKYARHQIGLTTHEVAAKIKSFRQSEYSGVENGRYDSSVFMSIDKISKLYGVTMEFLLFGSYERDSEETIKRFLTTIIPRCYKSPKYAEKFVEGYTTLNKLSFGAEVIVENSEQDVDELDEPDIDEISELEQARQSAYVVAETAEPEIEVYDYATAETDDSMVETDDSLAEPENSEIYHPNHYSGKYECIDVMFATFGADETKAFCKLNAFKYIWRANMKHESPREDIEKAKNYLNMWLNIDAGKFGE